ncbi:WYL domain-containing protein [Rhodococcus sp. BP-332]|uniref:helix-turn-helix transcriptional regulator n=1 Tax=Rhodococcus sp. BP-332 TaxID=2739447 RepID=UPI001C9B355C|nr:WYL domain-containing protein [Rhodococcus sp. BP-332]MBY6676562.1 WYL domain-containing protein [Rhodococcus sp. BP-332]
MSEPSSRMLTLLSLLQVRREWPGTELAGRLGVSPRTIRRDVDRLRVLGYNVAALRGSDGGYRLDGGEEVPPLLLDDDQVVALTLALQVVPAMGIDIADAAERALATLRTVMPTRVRNRVDALALTALPATGDPIDPAVLRTVGEAARNHELIRFDYVSAEHHSVVPPRRVEPHGVVGAGGRWYVVGWDLDRDDWRVFRVDRMTPKMRTGVRFTPRPIPGGSSAELLRRRFRGTVSGDWACEGEATVHLPAAEAAPFLADGTVEDLGDGRCRVRIGAWSWTGIAASLARFDAELEDLRPPELADAVVRVSERLRRAVASG